MSENSGGTCQQDCRCSIFQQNRLGYAFSRNPVISNHYGLLAKQVPTLGRQIHGFWHNYARKNTQAIRTTPFNRSGYQFLKHVHLQKSTDKTAYYGEFRIADKYLMTWVMFSCKVESAKPEELLSRHVVQGILPRALGARSGEVQRAWAVRDASTVRPTGPRRSRRCNSDVP